MVITSLLRETAVKGIRRLVRYYWIDLLVRASDYGLSKDRMQMAVLTTISLHTVLSCYYREVEYSMDKLNAFAHPPHPTRRIP